MSGVVALFHRDGKPLHPASLDAMLAAAPYRGPDGFGARCRDSIGLGHATMVVTPEDQIGIQPLESMRTGCILSADVRLDNRRDILARLPDVLPPTVSDAEIIMWAYEAWGIEAVPRLLGDFAFVLWDPRSRRIVCARDTSGQRTLFYRVSATLFAAASDIHQLLQDPAVPIRPNEERIRRRLIPRNMFRNEKDSADTYFEGIYALPAGHVLTVDVESLQLRRYWELEPSAEIRYRTDGDYAYHFRDLFFEVVRSRLRVSGPLGALLSGGLDSSSIVCVAQRLLQAGSVSGGLTTFSSVFAGLPCDEETLIRDIETAYDLPAEYVPSTGAGGYLQLHSSGFVESPNVGNRELRDTIGALAAKKGVRVLLSGDIADSCVAGSRLVFDSLLRHGHLREFWHNFRAYRRVSGESLTTTLGFACLAPLLPLEVQRALLACHVRREYGRNGWRWLPGWIAEPLRSELARRNVEHWLEDERTRRFASPARQQEYSLLYPPEIVRHPSPWPLEIWRPFADRRLHQFLLAIPPEQKYRPHPDTDDFYAGSKRILRESMRGIVPESIRMRTSKTMFQDQTTRELIQQWSMFEAAFGPSTRPEIVQREYVDHQLFWSRLIEARNGANGIDLVYLLELIGLESWLRALQQPRAQLVAPGRRLLVPLHN